MLSSAPGLVEAVLIVLAGVAAGTINTIVGSGSLITFPTLLFFGVPPVAANMSNTVGLVPGGLTASVGYRRELRGRSPLLRRLAPLTFAGAAVGAALLLVLPAAVFAAVVPALVALGLLLVVAGPRLQRRAAHREATSGHQRLLAVSVFLTGIYGGYFGAAQGVLLMGVMSALMTHDVQVLNGVKNVLALTANLVSAAVFLLVRASEIHWPAAAAIAFGSVLGGLLGARIGRRLHPTALRAVIVVVGVVAIARMTVLT